MNPLVASGQSKSYPTGAIFACVSRFDSPIHFVYVMKLIVAIGFTYD